MLRFLASILPFDATSAVAAMTPRTMQYAAMATSMLAGCCDLVSGLFVLYSMNVAIASQILGSTLCCDILPPIYSAE